jgi:predicted nuclease of predicted toxin-antitoxin system
MKVLCGVHLPYRLANQLSARRVDAAHVNRILDGSEPKDAAVAASTDANGMAPIAKDSDVRDSHLLAGTPSRLVRVTQGNLSNVALLTPFDERWDELSGVLAHVPRYVEVDRGGLVVFESPTGASGPG